MHLSKAFLLGEYVESSHEVPCLLLSCYISAYCKEKMPLNKHFPDQGGILKKNRAPTKREEHIRTFTWSIN